MIKYQNLTVARRAAFGVGDYEGVFVKLNAAGKLELTAANTAAKDVYGLITDNASTADGLNTVAVPGYSGAPCARLHAQSGAVQDGDQLILATNGTVKPGTTGTAVAVALESAAAGSMVMVRLIEPRTATA